MITHDENSTHLIRDAERYAIYRGISANSAYQITYCVSRLTRWLNRTATREDLNSETINGWLAYEDARLSKRSVKNLRANLLAIWRDLAEQGFVLAPTRIRLIKVPEPCPIAWTDDEFRSLLQACLTFKGKLKNGVERSKYLTAIVRCGYDSGLRRSDLFILERSRIRRDGSIAMVQHKTGGAHQPRLRPETLDMVLSLPGPRPLAWPGNIRGFYWLWKRVIAAADVRHGALQQVRRTGATALHKTHPQDVQRYLGHKTATMQKHYVDLSISRPQINLPPFVE